MASIHLELDDAGSGADFVLEDGSFRIDRGLRTLVLVSLFSDARRRDVDPPPDDEDEDPRGAWFDTPARRFGSRLYQFERAKATQETREDAREAVEEALRWMVDEGIVEFVIVVVTYPEPERMLITIELVRGTAVRWPDLWEAELDQAVEFAGNVVRILTR